MVSYLGQVEKVTEISQEGLFNIQQGISKDYVLQKKK